MYIKAPATVFALEARRAAIVPFCATDVNAHARGFLQRRKYAALLARLQVVKFLCLRRIAVQRYRRAQAAAVVLHAAARAFLATRAFAQFVQRCQGGYVGRPQRHGQKGLSSRIAPRGRPIPPRFWARTLQVRQRPPPLSFLFPLLGTHTM